MAHSSKDALLIIRYHHYYYVLYINKVEFLAGCRNWSPADHRYYLIDRICHRCAGQLRQIPSCRDPQSRVGYPYQRIRQLS